MDAVVAPFPDLLPPAAATPSCGDTVAVHPSAEEVAFRAAPLGLAVLDLDFRYLTVNPCFTRMYGLREEDFLGRTVEEALPEPAPQIVAHMRLALEQDTVVEREIALHDPSAPAGDSSCEVIYLRTARPVHDQSGAVFGIAVALLDITERKRLDRALKASEEDLRYTVELTPHIPWTADPNGELTFISPRWNGLVGQPPGPVLLEGWARSLHPEDRTRAANMWFASVRHGHPYDVEYRIHTASGGGWRWVRARAYPRRLPNNQILRWYGTVEDIHDRKCIGLELQDATEELARRALQDHLTSLSNRRHFDQVLLGEIDRAQRTGLPLALILMDVDHFKLFNDIAGHLLGDECLKAVATALTSIIRHPTDLVARFGGEEFALVLPSTDLEGALVIAERAISTVAALRLHHTDTRVQQVTISAGVALFRDDSQFYRPGSMPLLIEAADSALYQAKRNGRNRVFHEHQLAA